jgi:hypothetical protein
MKKFNLTNRQLLNLYKGLEAVKDMKGSRFAVLVGKNMKELKFILDPIEKAAIPTPEFQELSVKVHELLKDEKSEEIEALEEENKELIDARKQQMDEINDLLDASAEVSLHPIKEEQLPEEITGEQVEHLLEIIE